jgi:predicted nucleic acid-binding Zn ribbon protein
MKSAGDVLKDTINKLGLRSQMKSHQVWHIWDKAVGPHIAAVAQPEDIKGKTLFVNVRDSIWLRQLKFLEAMIIAKLNEAIGEKAIGSIYFRLGEVNSRKSKVESQELRVNSQLSTDFIDLSSIKDTTLKETLQRIISKVATTGRKR